MSKDLDVPLGRWNIESCTKKMNYKVDRSNEDHCGPCGYYVLEKIEINDTKNPIVDLEEARKLK